MGLSAANLSYALNALAHSEPAFARALEAVGMPEPRIYERGYAALLRTIIGQQVSVSSARTTWQRLGAALGSAGDPVILLAASDETLRAAGLTRQKTSYARSLAGLINTGELDLDRLPEDNESAIAALIRAKGIGRWSAEIYLLFSEGRPDIWPAGDLAIQVAIGKIVGLANRPSEKALRVLAEAWRPYRGAAAIFAWHHYISGSRVVKRATPL
jgi:DNA-3-methyladenine glycosylase II